MSTSRRVASTAILFALLLEAGSWTFLSVHNHWPFSPARYQRERHRLVALADELSLTLDYPDDPTSSYKKGESLHPYVGFTDGDRRRPWGVLDASPLRRRSPDTVIVGVVGGSVAELTVLAARKELVHALQKAPRFKDKKVALVNLALRGFKQPQQLMMLNYLLAAGGEFDILINLDGVNEVALHPSENEPKGVSYLYPRHWAERVARAPDLGALRLRGELELLVRRRREWAEALSARPLAWSMTANLIWQLADWRLTAKLIAVRSRLLDYKTGEPNVGPPQPYAGEAGMYAALAALWKQGSIQLDRLCRANGISYYHFLQPNQYFEGSKPMSQSERAIAYHAEHPNRSGVRRGYPLLRQAGAELLEMGVHFRDLSMLFVDHREALYEDDCCLYNQAGEALVARTIGETIVKETAR